MAKRPPLPKPYLPLPEPPPVLPLTIVAYGEPVAKQSFRAVRATKRTEDGELKEIVRGYQTPRIKAWTETIGYAARPVLAGCGPLTGHLKVTLDFYLPTRRRVDADNLSKCVLDALTQAGLWEDDKQIMDLHVRKHHTTRPEARVEIVVEPCPHTDC